MLPVNKNLVFIALAALIVAGFFVFKAQTPQKQSEHITTTPSVEQYNPKIDPANFVPEITNKYHTLKPGTKFSYKETTKDGEEKIDVVVTKETKQIMGVTTTVVRDTVTVDGQMKEDTLDYYAQDKEGNVWYFGEKVDFYVPKGTLRGNPSILIEIKR